MSMALVLKKKDPSVAKGDDEEEESEEEDDDDVVERDKTCLELLFPCLFKNRGNDQNKERKETDLGETGSEFEISFS